jgi:hypothetical protein
MNKTTTAHGATAGVDMDKLPRIFGVSRDAESPGGKAVLVTFHRALSDDELRAFHEILARRAQPRVTEQDEQAAFNEARQRIAEQVYAMRLSDDESEERALFLLWKDGQTRATQQAAPEAPALTDTELDDLAKAYFAEEWAQKHVKNAIHDAFVIARRPSATQQAGAITSKSTALHSNPAGLSSNQAATTASASEDYKRGYAVGWDDGHIAGREKGRAPAPSQSAAAASASEWGAGLTIAHYAETPEGLKVGELHGLPLRATAPSQEAAPLDESAEFDKLFPPATTDMHCDEYDALVELRGQQWHAWKARADLAAKVAAALAQQGAAQAPEAGSISADERFMAALNSYMDAVTYDERNSDRRIACRLKVFAAANDWRAAQAANAGADFKVPKGFLLVGPGEIRGDFGSFSKKANRAAERLGTILDNEIDLAAIAANTSLEKK